MGKRDKEPDISVEGMQDYVWALQILDSDDPIEEIVDKMQVAEGGYTDGIKAALDRLREIVRLRGWKPQVGVTQLAFRAKVSGWQPKVTPESSSLRLNLDIAYPAPEALPVLWDALGKPHDVILRGTVRQPALGEEPPVWDILTIIVAHESGVHRVLPDMECPMCLADLAAKQLPASEPPEALEGGEPTPGEPETEEGGPEPEGDG